MRLRTDYSYTTSMRHWFKSQDIHKTLFTNTHTQVLLCFYDFPHSENTSALHTSTKANTDLKHARGTPKQQDLKNICFTHTIYILLLWCLWHQQHQNRDHQQLLPELMCPIERTSNSKHMLQMDQICVHTNILRNVQINALEQ